MISSPYTLTDIEAALRRRFPDAEHLTLHDDSAAHAGHSGNPDGHALSHIHITVRDASLAGLRRVAQHQAVHAALQPFYDLGLHAVVLDIQATHHS